MAKSLADICRVSVVAQDRIEVDVLDSTEFKNHTGRSLTIGSYLKIADDDDHSVIAVVNAYRIKDPAAPDPKMPGGIPSFVIEAQPVGFLTKGGEFRRGGQHIAIPPTKVALAKPAELAAVYSTEADAPLVIGTLSREPDIEVPLDGNAFFAKHVAVVGSTGSGKSCTVAKILQEATAPNGDQMKRKVLNNSHVILFDLHGEYAAAFPNRAKLLDVDSLRLPYWLLNSEELEDIFILSNEQNSHNQITQFRHAVLENKRRHNKGSKKLSIDTPVYFSLEEVYKYLVNINNEIIGKKADENCPIVGDDREKVRLREDKYFESILTFSEQKSQGADKAIKGPYNGEFDRFVLRLRTVLDDERMAFLLKPRKGQGSDEFKTDDLPDLAGNLIGYGEKEHNVTIIDLSGIPFEVLSLVVSLVSRVIFDVGFHMKKLGLTKHDAEIPLLVVYEEAHLYSPNSAQARYKPVTKAIERIAKEGRKYGIGLMIVSQRPSEIAETIFSQCNNIVAMRLTNPNDQNYVKRMLPDAVAALTDSLPVLEQREALLIGDALQVPAVIRVGEIADRPASLDVDVLSEWREDWRKVLFATVVEGMKRR
jgi:uncharacterized protein